MDSLFVGLGIIYYCAHVHVFLYGKFSGGIFKKVCFPHYFYGAFCLREMAVFKALFLPSQAISLLRKPYLGKGPRIAGTSYPLEKGARRTQCAFVYSGAAKEARRRKLTFFPRAKKGKATVAVVHFRRKLNPLSERRKEKEEEDSLTERARLLPEKKKASSSFLLLLLLTFHIWQWQCRHPEYIV